MKRPKVLIVASNQPLDNDARIRLRIESSQKRADRQAPRFPDLNLPAMQREINRRLLRSTLSVNDRFMDLLDLLNFVVNGRQAPALTPENVGSYYSLAHSVTLNGIYLYQFLQRAGFDPLLVQSYSACDLPALLEKQLLAACISSNFIFMEEIRSMALRIKAIAPEVPVVVGGMLAKKILDPGEDLSQEALAYFSSFSGAVDAFVVEAQGEQTLVRLLRAFERGEDLAKVPNLAFFIDGRIVFTPRRQESLSMDRTAIEWDRIPKPYLRNTLPVNSSRGCAFRCRFCTYHWFYPRVHYKSLDVLMKELRAVQALGFVKHIRFTDDNFTANKARLEKLMRMMIDEGFDFTWSCFARAGALTPELAALMKASGAEFVDMGLESGSQAILNNMDKKLDREQSLRAVEMLNEVGIYSRGSFIVGYPGETEETFSETVDFINESGLPYYHPYLFYYSRQSLVHRAKDRFGLKGIGSTWRHDTMDAAEAAYLLSQMVRRIPRSFTDGYSYVEEIYKLLRGEGFPPRVIHELFGLKRELLLAGSEGNGASSKRREQILLRVRDLIK